MIWMAVAPLFFSAVITYFALNYEEAIRQWSWVSWLLFYLATCLSMSLALTPTTFIALLSGYFLGWPGLLPMIAAYLAASFTGYNLTRFIDKGEFMESIRLWPNVQRFIDGLKSREFGVIVLSRISPVLPFAIMNVVLAIMGVRLSHFLGAGFLGMLPRTMIFLWMGSQAMALKALLKSTATDPVAQVSFIVLLLISAWGFYRYIKKLIPHS